MEEHTSESTRSIGAAPLWTPTSSWIEWIRQGLRASTLRAVRHVPEGPGAWAMLLILIVLVAIHIGALRLEVDGPASFDLRLWLFGWAPSMLLVFGLWLVFNWTPEQTTHASPVAAWYLLYSVATLPITLVGAAIGLLVLSGQEPTWWSEGSWLAWMAYAALWVWSAITTWRVSRAFTRSTAVAVSLLLYVLAAQVLASWQLRTQPWQSSESYDEGGFTSFNLSQELFESQQGLLKAALQAITPSAGNERQTYGVIYAPYDEDVFLRESAMVQQVLEERFGARGHVVRLVNNAATADKFPWATTLNLERSLHALVEAMDTERDVLVVYLTSHGGADFKLAAENWPLQVEDLTADQLRTMLDDLGVRNRVIAVSACYSGGWIEPLQSEDTLVMTAADKDHTSYGCGSKSELTFFGRAVFDEQLRKTLSFEEAFNTAVPLIRQREIEAKKDDGFSNPQLSVGKNIRRVLAELTKPNDSAAGARIP